MEKRRFLLWSGLWLAIGLLVCACNFPTSAPSPTPDLAATAQALAATLNAVPSATPGALTSPSVPQAPPTASPTTVPPTPTASPTLGPPRLSVSLDTRCRTGPGKPFEQVGAVRVGEKVVVLGRWDNYWLVRLGDGTVCWVWGQYATVTGDLRSLPTVTPPPTPPPVGTIQGIVFSDHNRNGRFDPGTDSGIEQITIYLNAATGGQCDSPTLDQTQSDAQGKFSFTVAPATYCVWAQMAGMPVCHDREIVTVRPGKTVKVAFYIIPCSPLDPNCVCP